MKKRVTLAAIALFTIATLFTSCKRGGYGCPYEMKISILK